MLNCFHWCLFLVLIINKIGHASGAVIYGPPTGFPGIVFNSSGTWNAPSSGTINVLVVAGGGGGGSGSSTASGGGGGGAQIVQSIALPVIGGANYTVTVGAGGIGGAGGTASGGKSSFLDEATSGTLTSVVANGGQNGYSAVGAVGGAGGAAGNGTAGAPASGSRGGGGGSDPDAGVGTHYGVYTSVTISGVNFGNYGNAGPGNSFRIGFANSGNGGGGGTAGVTGGNGGSGAVLFIFTAAPPTTAAPTTAPPTTAAPTTAPPTTAAPTTAVPTTAVFTLFDNTATASTSHVTSTYDFLCNSFSTDSSSYLLDSVSLALSSDANSAPSGLSPAVYLFPDSGDQGPYFCGGAIHLIDLASLSLSTANASPLTTFTFTDTTYSLHPQTRYWMCISADGTSVNWDAAVDTNGNSASPITSEFNYEAPITYLDTAKPPFIMKITATKTSNQP